MMRVAVAVAAIALGGAPLMMAPVGVVGVVGAVGLALAAVGIVAPWRRPITAAACAFLVAYALALLVAEAPPNIVAAAAFGVGLLALLQAGDLALRTRRAAVSPTVIWSQLGRGIGLAAGVLAAALLAVALAQGLAPALPFAATPFLAAAGALGIMVGLAAVIARAAHRARGGVLEGTADRRRRRPG